MVRMKKLTKRQMACAILRGQSRLYERKAEELSDMDSDEDEAKKVVNEVFERQGLKRRDVKGTSQTSSSKLMEAATRAIVVPEATTAKEGPPLAVHPSRIIVKPINPASERANATEKPEVEDEKETKDESALNSSDHNQLKPLEKLGEANVLGTEKAKDESGESSEAPPKFENMEESFQERDRRALGILNLDELDFGDEEDDHPRSPRVGKFRHERISAPVATPPNLQRFSPVKPLPPSGHQSSMYHDFFSTSNQVGSSQAKNQRKREIVRFEDVEEAHANYKIAKKEPTQGSFGYQSLVRPPPSSSSNSTTPSTSAMDRARGGGVRGGFRGGFNLRGRGFVNTRGSSSRGAVHSGHPNNFVTTGRGWNSGAARSGRGSRAGPSNKAYHTQPELPDE